MDWSAVMPGGKSNMNWILILSLIIRQDQQDFLGFFFSFPVS